MQTQLLFSGNHVAAVLTLLTQLLPKLRSALCGRQGCCCSRPLASKALAPTAAGLLAPPQQQCLAAPAPMMALVSAKVQSQ
jgi:hypothetical protein